MKRYFKTALIVFLYFIFIVLACIPAAANEAGTFEPANMGYSGEGDAHFHGPLLAAASSEESVAEEDSRPPRRRRNMEPEIPEGIADPLEPMNRIFFEFNDKLYFWLLKPVSTGYEKVVPWEIRTCTGNFFRNLLMPVRAVNCLLQGKIDGFGDELLRFVINTTAGFGGLADPAAAINIMPREEDLGQTLGSAGVGHGIFIMWPVLGPSSVRDTVGMAGDGFLSVMSYYPDEFKYRLGIRGLERINDTSFKIGDYESFKDAAFDPYSAVRDAYFQIREKKVRE
ncbi:MAG: VacJ family lipoprotein [Desulfatiglandaceae bacterium]